MLSFSTYLPPNINSHKETEIKEHWAPTLINNASNQMDNLDIIFYIKYQF